MIVQNTMDIGGAEKSLINLLNALDYEKYAIDLLVLSKGNQMAGKIRPEVNIRYEESVHQVYLQNINHINLSFLPRIFSRLLRYGLRRTYIAVTSFISRLKSRQCAYDVAIAYNQGFAAIYVQYYVRSNKTLVFYHQGHSDGMKRELWCYKRYDKIIAVSNGVLNMMAADLPSIQHKLVFMNNIIDLQDIRELARIDRAFDASEIRYGILSCGRLSPEKGFGIIVPICKKLVDANFTSFHWTIIGDGVERQKIEQEIRSHEVSDYIDIIGWKENPYPYIQGCDLYVQPSITESYGLTMVEAQILGSVVLASETIGAKEVIQNRATGFIVPRTADAFADMIQEIHSNPALVSEIKSNLQSIDFRASNAESLAKFEEFMR